MPLAAGADLLFQALEEYRDACVAALADTEDGPPSCVYISPGVPSWDAIPSLTIHCGGPVVAPTLPQSPALAEAFRIATTGEVDLFSLTATILRCAPTLIDGNELPPPDTITAVARQTSSDLAAIWSHVKQRHREGTLFGPKDAARELVLDPAVSVSQQGGACGWQIPLRVRIPGYKPGVDP